MAVGGYRSLSDYLTAKLAELHRLPTPGYIKRDDGGSRPAVQDQLPGSTAAA